MSRFLIGLGNPGQEYSLTRHNLGFAIVDELSSRLSIGLRAGRGGYLIGRGRAESGESSAEVYLVKPLTFVNGSGIALLDLSKRYEVQPAEILVICDDVNLPLGKIRLRRSGSDGGHKGLQSIIYHLKTEQFPRLRMGIGKPDQPDLTDFVLATFDREELDVARDVIGRASEAAICWAVQGIEKAMSVYNVETADSP